MFTYTGLLIFSFNCESEHFPVQLVTENELISCSLTCIRCFNVASDKFGNQDFGYIYFFDSDCEKN